MNRSVGFAFPGIVFLVLGVAMLLCQPAFAQEEVNDFNSIDLLSTTIYGIDTIMTQAEIDQLALDNADLQTEIDTNNTDNDLLNEPLQGQIDDNQLIIDDPATDQATIDALTLENEGLQGQIDDNNLANGDANSLLQATIDANTETTAGLQAQLDYLNALSPDQVFALNRNLNNAIHSGLILNFDPALLQRILDEDFDKHQINFLIIALEQEARFLAKCESTGRTFFCEKADIEKEKFLARIDSHNTVNHDDMANEAAREAAKEARIAAREAAKEARDEAKADRDATREAAKAAQEAIVEARKETARDNGCLNSNGKNPNC